MNHFSSFELEEFFTAHQAKCSINIGSSGCKEFSLRKLLDYSEHSVDSLLDIVLTDSDPAGAFPLRTQIAKQYLKADPQEILVTNGSSEALYLIMACLLKPQDHVIATIPSYQSLIELPTFFGAQVDQLSMFVGDEIHFPVEQICEKISAKTKLIIINSPHNPTGAILPKDEMVKIVNCAEKYDAWILFDEAFIDIVYDKMSIPTGKELGNRCITVGTLSKSFGLTGLRLGWCYADTYLIECMKNLKHYTSINLSPLIEAIAMLVFRNREKIISLQKTCALEGLIELKNWIPSHFHWTPPYGGTCCYPKLPNEIDSDQFCKKLANEHGVFLVPGSVFGNKHHIRFGFGHGIKHVQAGIKAIEQELKRV